MVKPQLFINYSFLLMKKYLLFVLCACFAMYVAADDSLRSHAAINHTVAGNQGNAIIANQDGQRDGLVVTEVTSDDGGITSTITIPVSAGRSRYIMDVSNPVIKGGGFFPPKTRKGKESGATVPKSIPGVPVVLPDFSYSPQVGNTVDPTQVDPVYSPRGGGYVPLPHEPHGFYGDPDVIAYVSSRDDRTLPCTVITSVNDLPDYASAAGENAVPVMTGDVNGDGLVDVLDVTALIGHVMGQTPERFILSNARVAGGGEDRAVDVSDVTSLIQHVLDDTLPTEE